MTKKTNDPVVTESFLEKRLERQTKEILDVMMEMFNNQNQILAQILATLDGTKKDSIRHSVRLDDHDVRIEKLEKAVN